MSKRSRDKKKARRKKRQGRKQAQKVTVQEPSLDLAPSAPTLRDCDGCRECCTGLAIEELDKPDFHSCEHECETGCSIYDDRPQSCRVFDCEWLKGLTAPGVAAKDLRPDKTGLVPVVQNTKFGTVWTLFQTKEGADKTFEGKALIDHLYRQAPVILMTKENRRWIIHPRFASVLEKIRELTSVQEV